MGYVHPDKPDIFLSYARVNDQEHPSSPDRPGWVTTLKRCIEIELEQLLGRKGSCELWSDARLEGHVRLTDEILSRLRNASVLVVVLSPGYLASKWCFLELKTFEETIRDRIGSNRRIFVVEFSEIDRAGIPVQLDDLRCYRFYSKDPDTKKTMPLGYPVLDGDDRQYHRRMNDLCAELAELLKSLALSQRPAAETVPLLPATDGRSALAVGETPEERRDRLTSEVERHEYRDSLENVLLEILLRLFELKHLDSQRLALRLGMAAIPDEEAQRAKAVAAELVEGRDHLPTLVSLIHECEDRQAKGSAALLEECLNRLAPYHFPLVHVVGAMKKIPGRTSGLVVDTLATRCGAELVMAAFDGSGALFRPNDEDLTGVHARDGLLPPLGAMHARAEAERFLAAVLGVRSPDAWKRAVDWHKKLGNRTLYCIVAWPREDAEQQALTAILSEAGALLPELPIFLLRSDGPYKDDEEIFSRAFYYRLFRAYRTPR